MSQYYIATRASFDDMHKAVGNRVSRLNQKMATTLRQAAMSLDIKQKTKDGGRLEFYCVDQAGFDTLTDSKAKTFALLKGAGTIRPLAWLDRAALQTAINQVNAKYSGRMDYQTHQRYLRELRDTTQALLTKLEDDAPTARPVRAVLPANPFKVGDLLSYEWPYSAPKGFEVLSNCRVARVSKAYVWLEIVSFKDHMGVQGVWSNTDTAQQAFRNVQAYGTTQQGDNHGHFIPLEQNTEVLEWRPQRDHQGRLVRHRWDKVTNWRRKPQPAGTPTGYCYGYEPRWD